MHAKSESDVTSLAPSSPSRSPKRPVYFVQSPSRDSHDGDKSSSLHATPACNSPMESPSHPSFGRHSRDSSASRFSGVLRSSSGRKGDRKRADGKGWLECDVIQEEGAYDNADDDGGLSRKCQVLIALLAFVLLFATFCLIIWGISRPYKAEVVVESLLMNNFYSGEGTDATGVPTKLVTANCSLKLNVYNPAGMFGIHVTSSPINLMYSEITVATGKLQKHYQPRKSHRTVSVLLEGDKVPLYGAGAGLALSNTGGKIPLTLDFDLFSRGDVVGKLVRVRHRKHVTCPIVVDSSKTKAVKVSQGACTYV
ncbi:Uncharacterized protein M6B38_225725 [Iris pallida]|uniref:Late embryogenesis abundant protein LEA-2 subgroup domain-containing protein n=1 Tax=Iris pallida TaxID=29817 RepID=A0AAX6DV51_IRIPA|nr:Uncharacterized protein M6B38_225725 [Iris pallida]